jgi:hypothetical protein
MARCLLVPKIEFEIEWLKENLREGDQVLPLDLNAFVRMHGALPSLRYVEEFVPYHEIMQRAMKACELNEVFARIACGGETYEGYDLPAVCSSYQDFFFRDLLLTEALANSLRKNGFTEIVWVGNPANGPFLYVPTESAITGAFRHYLGEHFSILQPPRQTIFNAVRTLSGKIGNAFALLQKRVALLRPGHLTKCRVAAVFPSSDEWERFSDAMADLSREFGDQFQIWSLGRCTDKLQNWANLRKIRVVRVTYPDWVPEGVVSFFEKHWHHWQAKEKDAFAEGSGCSVLASKELEEYFRYHFMVIWPRVARFARVLEDNLKTAGPDWVIGSTNPIPPQLFPYDVAAKLGIRSVALPHGYVQHGDVHIGSSFLACRNAFERYSFIRSFRKDKQVLYCKDAGNELSYAADETATLHTDEKRLVAILTFNPDIPGTLMSSVDRKTFLEGFHELFVPPGDFSDFHFVVKSHPRWDMSEFVRNVGIRPAANVEILNPHLSLVELLSRSWAVVMYNYFGSAVVHAISVEKPVLFVNTSKPFWPETEWFSFGAGDVFESFPAFWEHLRDLKNLPQAYANSVKKCQRFKRENLEERQVTLSKVIRSVAERETMNNLTVKKGVVSDERIFQ